MLNSLFIVAVTLFISSVEGTGFGSYIVEKCNIKPEESGLPCVQYNIINPMFCNGDEGELSKLFPHLYTIDDMFTMSWPGPIHRETIMNRQANITWNGPQDGNINFLKGYQIIEMGSSYPTMNTFVCKVIDLSNVTSEHFSILRETTFAIYNDDSGSYDVTVKPLPFPALDFMPDNTLSLAANPMVDEYHPDINISVDYIQVSNNTVNVSLYVVPETEEVEVLTILVFSIDGQKVGEKKVGITQDYFLIENLEEGTYKLQMIPDRSINIFATRGSCVCYKGTSTSRVCVTCRRYTKIIEVSDKEPNTTSKPT